MGLVSEQMMIIPNHYQNILINCREKEQNILKTISNKTIYIVLTAAVLSLFCWSQQFFVQSARASENQGTLDKDSNAGTLSGQVTRENHPPEKDPGEPGESDDLNEADQNREENLNRSVIEEKNDSAKSSSEIQVWEERYESLMKQIDLGTTDQEEADALFNELDSVLAEKGLIFKRTLSNMPRKPDILKMVFSIQPSDKSASVATDPSDKHDFRQAFENLQNLYETSLLPFYNMRIALLQVVTPELRSVHTGIEIEGVTAFIREIEMVILAFQFQGFMIPYASQRFIHDTIYAPLPLLGRLFKLFVALILLRLWQGWAPKGLPDLRKSILDKENSKPVNYRLSWGIWYFERIRKPFEWIIILSLFLALFEIPELQWIDDLLWGSVFWVLSAWTIVLLINALAERVSVGRESDLSKIRFRSFRLVALWLLTFKLGLSFAEYLTGQGAIYAWTWRLFKFLSLPVCFTLIRWWKAEIFKTMEQDPTTPKWLLALVKHKKGWKSYLFGIPTGVYTFIMLVRRLILRVVISFAGGQQLIANLTRIEALRAMENQMPIRNSRRIPDNLRRSLLTPGNFFIESVAKEEISKLNQLIKDGGQADRQRLTICLGLSGHRWRLPRRGKELQDQHTQESSGREILVNVRL